MLIGRAGVRYFYNRVGGYSLPGALLEGPEKFAAYVANNLETPVFELELFFHGVAIANGYTRDLFWWSDGLKSAAWRRMFESLLALMWPGWTIETTMAPERALDARFPGSADRLLRRETDRITAEDALARNVAECDDDRTWLCVRDEDGALRDAYLAGDPPLVELTAGPDVLDLLAAHRPTRTLEELWLSESRLQAGAFVDRARRQLWWWSTSSWLRGPASDLESAWPGWEVTPLPGGPRAQLALTDRGDAPLFREHCLHALREDFERAMRLQDSAAVREHFERLLQAPEWQPSPS